MTASPGSASPGRSRQRDSPGRVRRDAVEKAGTNSARTRPPHPAVPGRLPPVAQRGRIVTNQGQRPVGAPPHQRCRDGPVLSPSRPDVAPVGGRAGSPRGDTPVADPANSGGGHDDRGGMPVAALVRRADQPSDAGGMPKPSMGEQSGSGDMPRPGPLGRGGREQHTVDLQHHARPRPAAPEAQALPRFGRPADQRRDRRLRAGRRRGPVPRGRRPETAARTGSALVAAEGVGAALDEMNQILQRTGWCRPSRRSRPRRGGHRRPRRSPARRASTLRTSPSS